jgi:hypothetical protein
MGNEGLGILAFPLPPSAPYIYPLAHLQRVFWPREGALRGRKYVPGIVKIKRLSPFEYGFPIWVSRVNIVSTLSWNVLQLLCVYSMVCGLILCDEFTALSSINES